MSTIVHFLERAGVVRDGRVIEPELYAVFSRCLERNLKCGLSHHTLSALWSDAQEKRPTVPYPLKVALGVSARVEEVNVASARWYASRKLDGIRCLIFVGGDDAAVAVSRTGRQLAGAAGVTRSVAGDLCASPPFAALASRDRLVIDGELCVIEEHGDGTFMEDYNATASAAKSKRVSDDLVYFPFDLLTYTEFCDWMHGTRLFSERAAVLDKAVAWCLEHRPDTPLRRLPQQRLRSAGELVSLHAHALEQGWEGLMLRRDEPYEARRSSAIRKIKEWQDAEYVVQDIECRTMSLMVDGVIVEEHALSNIIISHKGNRVSVGSGFTSAQRLHYAAHPDQLIGRMVTVTYFEESTSQLGGHL
ncbi:hypothetical protein MCUN1_000152 [Malassezia cuniculi]|uniref:DNA ligase n=1 Tax=Malassezia cuniculi TaxID=948313 RepID=A0AAF0ER26_9BASI|nr:hypothetical protein MCUN1_000152 [Malassezia cuniculi]